MGAVGGVAILGGNFEAPQFPEDKTVQRSLTAGTQETTPIDAVILDSPDLGAPGQRDSHATVWKGHSNDGSPHSIDWKVFVDVTADDGTGSLWTLQTRIDAAPYVSVLTIDDNGLLTVSGATFTMDQLIVDTDNAEAVLIRKDGDAGDVFIVDTIAPEILMGTGETAPLEILVLDTPALAGDGQRDSHSILWTGKGFETATPHDIDWKMFVDVTSDDGTGSIFTWQTRIDGAGYTTVFQLDDAGNLTIPGSFTVDGLIIDVTSTEAFLVRQDGDTGDLFRVDTTNGDLFVGEGVAPSRVVLTQEDLTGNGFEDSPFLVYEGKSFDGSAHTQQFITFVDMETNAGAGQWTLRSRFDGGSNVNLVIVTDEGRFAIGQPEQVSIGSQSFIDNVQVNITGSFIDDYGGGPTETHKLKIQGSQTGDTGRTNRQTSVDVDTSIITQNLSQTIDEVGGMFIFAPSITPGTDTITKAYTLKVMGNPTLSGTENYGLLVDSASAATNLTALTRIGKSFNQGIKLLVGGGVGFENIEGTAQMRLTNFYTPDGLQTEAMLLHVHTTLQATDGTTDHITGAFFQGSLRTQVEADENVANISQVRIDEPNIQDNLTGTGEITNAQSLLITGAPTEGESNYAQRILGGDLQVSASSAFLFRNNSDTSDLTALANAPTDFLQIGGVGSGDWERVEVFSLGSIDLRPTDDVTVFSDVTNPFLIRSLTPNEELFRVSRTQVRAVGQLVSVANLADHRAETQMQTTFVDVATSAGSSVTAASLIPAGSFVIGVTVRNIGNIGGPASYDVGDGIDVDRWGAAISVAAGTTTDITDYTTGAVTTFPAANDVVLTSTGVDFTSGTVRITVHYTTLLTSAS